MAATCVFYIRLGEDKIDLERKYAAELIALGSGDCIC